MMTLIPPYFRILWAGLWALTATAALAAPPPLPVHAERAFLHLPRAVFLAGETVHFSFLAAHAETAQPSRMSATGYVALQQQDGLVIWQGKVALAGGLGTGAFALPEQIPSGWYCLVAYTRWMRAEGEACFFRAWIQVLQPEAMPPVGLPDAGLILRALPEGGTLTAGAAHRVAISAMQPDGRGGRWKGEIRTASGASVARFETNKVGMACPEFTPEQGAVYEVVVLPDSGKPVSAALPPVGQGPSIQVLVRAGVHFAQVRGRLPEAAAWEMWHKGKLLQRAGISGGAEWKLPDEWEGVALLRLVDEKNQLRAQRYVGKLEFWGGEGASVGDFSEAEGVWRPATGNESGALSVSLPGFISPTFQAYLGFEACLPEPLPFPFRFFRSGDWSAESLEWALMLMQPGATSGEQVEPEPFGQIVAGQLLDETGAPLPQVSVFLATPQPQPLLKHGMSDSSGRFFWVLEHAWRQVPALIVRAETENAYQIAWEPTFARVPRPAFWPNLRLSDEELLAANRLYRGVQVSRAYAAPCEPPPVPVAPFWGAPNITYRMEDFVAMPTEDILREIVVETHVAVRKRRKFIFILRKDGQGLFDLPPLMLVDGVPVFDAGDILSIKHRNLDRIEVVNETFYLQGRPFAGVLNVVTRQGDFSGGSLRTGDQRLFLQTYLPPIQEALCPQNSDDRIPDYRNDALPITQTHAAPQGFAWPQEAPRLLLRWNGWDAQGRPASREKWIEQP